MTGEMAAMKPKIWIGHGANFSTGSFRGCGEAENLSLARGADRDSG